MSSALDAIDATRGLCWASQLYKRGRFGKHMPDYSRKDDWDQVVRETGGKKPVSRYIHTLTHEDIHRIEQECITNGNPIYGDATGGVFWREMKEVIGASLGEETKYVRVEVTSRVYHGRPITRAERDDEIAAHAESST